MRGVVVSTFRFYADRPPDVVDSAKTAHFAFGVVSARHRAEHAVLVEEGQVIWLSGSPPSLGAIAQSAALATVKGRPIQEALLASTRWVLGIQLRQK